MTTLEQLHQSYSKLNEAIFDFSNGDKGALCLIQSYGRDVCHMARILELQAQSSPEGIPEPAMGVPDGKCPNGHGWMLAGANGAYQCMECDYKVCPPKDPPQASQSAAMAAIEPLLKQVEKWRGGDCPRCSAEKSP